MMEEPTNRDLLARWEAGDEAAAQILVDRYLARLTALARSRLSRRLARRLDPEDVVLSAWRSFFVATGRGRVTVPEDDNLWPVLVTLTLRKLSRQAARHHAERRDVSRDQPLNEASNWMAAVSNDPTPEEAAALIDQLEHLLSQMSHQDREIVSRRLRGDASSDIAATLKCSDRTVRRAMERFRTLATERHEDGGTRPVGSGSDGPAHLRTETSRTQPPQLSPTESERQPSYEFGDLILQQCVGQGGFGKVYRALERIRNRPVAVKFLRKALWREERAVSALLQETEIVSLLSHSSIIHHYGWGRTAAGAVFVVMEWVDGGDLSQRLKRGTLSANEAIRLSTPVAEALISAHQAGVVHGDVTPSNVLLGSSGRVVLTDFGFATMLRHETMLSRGGTPGFLAPEQVSEAFGRIDGLTDVYGVGALLYALLTGRPPFVGRDVPETLAMVLSSRSAESVDALRDDVPPGLVTLANHCLHKDPADRPQSIGDVVEGLLTEWGAEP